MFHEILFPIDFSDQCRRIAPAVAAMARRCSAPVTLFHAVPPVACEMDGGLVTRELEVVRDHQRIALDRFLTQSFDRIQVAREVVDGSPAHAIVARSATMKDPLIMMPTHGQSAFRQLLMGSVTSAVLHEAQCPVWTNAHTAEGGEVTGACRSIVCAVDMGPGTVRLLRAARQVADLHGAFFHVVHSVPGVDPRFESGPARNAHAFLVLSARDGYLKLAAEAGITQPLEIVEDVGLSAGIAAAASRHQADLVVIGRGSIQGVMGRLRTNAADLIRRSPCPVLSV
jgi:nucleotide-binding universal stress UspA family protein